MERIFRGVSYINGLLYISVVKQVRKKRVKKSRSHTLHLQRGVKEVPWFSDIHEVCSSGGGVERLLGETHQSRYTGYLLDKPV